MKNILDSLAHINSRIKVGNKESQSYKSIVFNDNKGPVNITYKVDFPKQKISNSKKKLKLLKLTN